MKKSIALAALPAVLAFLVSLAVFELASVKPIAAQSTGTWAFDPCTASFIQKSTKPVAIATATTTELVAAVAGKGVFVCSFSVELATETAASSFQLESGTKVSTACDTGAAVLTGAYPGPVAASAASASPVVSFDRPTTPVSSELCAVTTGAAVGVQGIVTYVQQ